MFTEKRALTSSYDPSSDTVTILVGHPTSPARDTASKATLLLDAEGFCVGVDLGGGGPARTVVMLGKHENVVRTRDVKVTITAGADGEVARIAIGSAKATLRGAERNPYVR